MNDPRVDAHIAGSPPVALLACRKCGVVLWDIDAHYQHAHPDQEPPL